MAQKKKEKNEVKTRLLFKVIFAVIALLVTFGAFYFVARHYYGQYPPLGNDFYHSFNLINFFEDNLSWPYESWRNIWHFGGPSIIAYPWLNFYLVQPLIKFFGMWQGSLYYFLGSIFLYGSILYFLFYRLSKSFFISSGLAVAVVWSASTWRLLVAGSLTLTVNQFLLALALLLIVIYLQNKNRKYLLLSSLVSGLSVVSQSGSGFPFIIPIVSLVILFWWQEKEKFWQIKRKIIDFLLYAITSLLVVSFSVYYTVVNILSSRGGFEIFDWMNEEAFSSIYTKTNPAIFIVGAFLLMGVLLLGGLKKLKSLLPFFAAAVYLLVFNLASIYGLNPFGSSLAPAETWFILTLLIALFVALLWPALINSFKRIKVWYKIAFSSAGIIILLTPFGFWQAEGMIDDFKESNMVCGVEDEDYVHKALIKDDFSGLKETFPNWFEDDINHRFFSLSWCVELWFNSFYKMPLSGGYDTLLTNKTNRNYINWSNEIFNGTMEQGGVNSEVIKNNMLFHIDWLAGRFIEKTGEFKYLEDKEIINLDNKPEGYRVFEFQDEITSPIIRPTNTPAMLVVSDQKGFDTVLRILAQENINSRYLIPIQGPEYVEDILEYDLSHFDGVFLYDYKYKNEKNFSKYPEKPWQALAAYVKSGGKLFLETGSEVKESDNKNLPVNNLPEVFPVTNTTREALGRTWDIQVLDEDFFIEVNHQEFDPPLYQGDPWKLSHSEEENIKDWAEPVFTHDGYPVLVSGDLESGRVIWSGLNFPYHIKSYNNIEEGKLFNNILSELFSLAEEKAISFDFKREKSENIKVSSEGTKGILFKETFYPGWQAKQGDSNLEIYKAGFGFMYAPAVNDNEITFTYKGETKYRVMFYISLLTVFLIFLYIILGKRLSYSFRKLFKLDSIQKKTKSWWEKDEEE